MWLYIIYILVRNGILVCTVCMCFVYMPETCESCFEGWETLPNVLWGGGICHTETLWPCVLFRYIKMLLYAYFDGHVCILQLSFAETECSGRMKSCFVCRASVKTKDNSSKYFHSCSQNWQLPSSECLTKNNTQLIRTGSLLCVMHIHMVEYAGI